MRTPLEDEKESWLEKLPFFGVYTCGCCDTEFHHCSLFTLTSYTTMHVDFFYAVCFHHSIIHYALHSAHKSDAAVRWILIEYK